MKIYSAALSLIFILAVYIAAIITIDINSGLFSNIIQFLHLLPILLVITFFSFLLRYFRWHWLLRRSGDEIVFTSGLLPYLSGFALTATPGKAGELIRVRYFSRLGSPSPRIVSVFIFERLLDLVVVLIIASFAAFSFNFFTIAATFVALITGTIALVILKNRWLSFIVANLRHYRFYRLARLIGVLQTGIKGIKSWLRPLDLTISFFLGFTAWCSVSLSFCWLLKALEIDIPFFAAVSSYPLAMLVGAASMLPGGLGSTEAAIIAQLTHYEIPISQAALAAIVIRFATLWFAILCGFLSILILEYKNAQP